MDSSYEPALKKFEADLVELNAKIAHIKYAIESLKNGEANNSISNGNAIISPVAAVSLSNDGDSPADKVKLVLDAMLSLNRFAKIQEIVNICKFTPDRVRSLITPLIIDKKVTKIQVTTSLLDTFWGLSEWKDGNTIKSEHLYDKTQLVGKVMK